MKVAAITLSAAALALAACGHKDKTTVTTDNTTTITANDTVVAPAPSADQAFANAAAASDAFEIATSKLALTKSSSSSIKTFAQKMIDAHTDSTAKLKAAVAGLTPTITPDPTLTSDQQTKLDSLQGLNGTAFDKAYAAAQVEGHQKTLDTLRAYSSGGAVPALKVFATKLVPTVTAHLNMAKGLKA
ncbi:MAG: DUF4142 domain-containing protein [Sphingomonas sp.]|uniref:DUF4142 domain-containing protein n=1 Tax=Sphingomonas sp. TaxID=28214 RepID=UPI001ACAB9FC|nr:DUF4142 domain-containing protein [Sphingomonas sp.]MBN8808274.1 DUF4142 domain-containing protein [Sphingomonas sp.]